MKERPIIFSGDRVLAILEGKKLQTRRICKIPKNATLIKYWAPPSGQSEEGWADPGINYWIGNNNHIDPCPYGQLGDRLWVRESIRCEPEDVYYQADKRSLFLDLLKPEQDAWIQNYDKDKENFTIPSIHMPRWASRILLEITNIRIERLNQINNNDAFAEGFTSFPPQKIMPVDNFRQYWDSVYLKRGYGWDTNPLVFVIEFKKVDR